MDCYSSPESSDEAGHLQTQFSKQPRKDRSLFQLTTRFIGALRDSADGTLDLNRVSDVDIITMENKIKYYTLKKKIYRNIITIL